MFDKQLCIILYYHLLGIDNSIALIPFIEKDLTKYRVSSGALY